MAADDKTAEDSLEVSLKGDLLKGNVETTVRVGAVTRLFRTMFPSFTARGRLQHAVVENIERQLKEGKAIAELSKAEQLLIASANLSELRKAANRNAILERAEKIEPSLFDNPDDASNETLPRAPGTDDPSAESTDEQQYFWERFWADAEVVSVPYFQELYARILTGKVKSPGAFSLRTLDTIRCLDERTGKLFGEVCQYTLSGYLVPSVFGPDRLFSALEVTALDDAGLVRADKLMPAIEPHTYSYGSWLLRLSSDSYAPYGLHPLTVSGRELLRMTPIQHTEARAIQVCKALAAGLQGETVCEVSKTPDGPWLPWREYFWPEPKSPSKGPRSA